MYPITSSLTYQQQNYQLFYFIKNSRLNCQDQHQYGQNIVMDLSLYVF